MSCHASSSPSTLLKVLPFPCFVHASRAFLLFSHSDIDKPSKLSFQNIHIHCALPISSFFLHLFHCKAKCFKLLQLIFSTAICCYAFLPSSSSIIVVLLLLPLHIWMIASSPVSSPASLLRKIHVRFERSRLPTLLRSRRLPETTISHLVSIPHDYWRLLQHAVKNLSTACSTS